jgi:hypothetical protein
MFGFASVGTVMAPLRIKPVHIFLHFNRITADIGRISKISLSIKSIAMSHVGTGRAIR